MPGLLLSSKSLQLRLPSPCGPSVPNIRTRGAVLSRLPREATVTSVKSTRHYGIEVSSCFDKTRDAGERTWVFRDGSTRCSTMTWYIHVGDDLRRDQKVRFGFFRDLEKNYRPEDLVFRTTLYESADMPAPIHRSKGEKFKINCTMKADLSAVDPKHFLHKTDKNGVEYVDIGYDLVMTLESAIMKFSLEIDGKELGSVYAQYD